MDALDRRIEGQRRDAVRAAVDLLAHELRETERPGDLARVGQHLAHVLRDWLADLDRVRGSDRVAATLAALDAEPDYWTSEGGFRFGDGGPADD